jgi:hypothetical protein
MAGARLKFSADSPRPILVDAIKRLTGSFRPQAYRPYPDIALISLTAMAAVAIAMLPIAAGVGAPVNP